MNKVYKLGKERMIKELDVSKLVKNLRFLKILVKNSFLNEKINFMIYHSRKNILNLDDENKEAFNKNLKEEITVNIMDLTESNHL